MRSSKNKLLLSCILLGTLSSSIIAKDIGSISVNSSTIDDKYDSKSLEVSSTSLITSEEVEKKHSENIANVLNSLPGLTVRINEGDSNKIHIRGIASEMYMGEKPGVAIVIDGVPVQERSGSVNIDSDNIESIKVIKGGASYLYGNDALAGAVIITTKRPKNKNGGKVSYERGSFDYEKTLARGYASSEDIALELQGSYKKSDGYWEDSDYWAKSFNSKLQYYINDSSDITLGIDKSTRFENDSGSITHIVDGVDNIATNPTSKGEVGYSTNYNIDLNKYFLTYSKDFDNNSNLMTQIYSYDDTTTNRSGAWKNTLISTTLRNDHKYDAYANTKQKGLKSEYRIDGDFLASLIGLDIARNQEDKNSVYRDDYADSKGKAHGTVQSDTKSEEEINALYAELKYKINEKLLTSINLRHDQINYDYTNNEDAKTWDKTYNETSYKVGASYKIKKNSVFFTNASTGFRVPSLSQMYAGDMNGTRSGTYSNNTNIKTEKTLNLEAGFRTRNKEYSYEVSLYNLDRNDVIGSNFGNYADTSSSDQIKYDNIGNIRNRGIEFSFKTSNKNTIHYSFNYTYLDSKYKDYKNYHLIVGGTDTIHDLSNNVVPRTSKHTANLELNYKAFPKLLLSSDIRYRSSQYADEMNQFKVKAYTLVDLRSSYKTKLSTFEVEFFAKVENVFDKQYYMMPRITGDRNDNGEYDIGDMGLTVNPGRVYLAGLSAKF